MRSILHPSWKIETAPMALVLCSAGPEGLETKTLISLGKHAGIINPRECLAWLEHHGLVFYRAWNNRWVATNASGVCDGAR